MNNNNYHTQIDKPSAMLNEIPTNNNLQNFPGTPINKNPLHVQQPQQQMNYPSSQYNPQFNPQFQPLPQQQFPQQPYQQQGQFQRQNIQPPRTQDLEGDLELSDAKSENVQQPQQIPQQIPQQNTNNTNASEINQQINQLFNQNNQLSQQSHAKKPPTPMAKNTHRGENRNVQQHDTQQQGTNQGNGMYPPQMHPGMLAPPNMMYPGGIPPPKQVHKPKDNKLTQYVIIPIALIIIFVALVHPKTSGLLEKILPKMDSLKGYFVRGLVLAIAYIALIMVTSK